MIEPNAQQMERLYALVNESTERIKNSVGGINEWPVSLRMQVDVPILNALLTIWREAHGEKDDCDHWDVYEKEGNCYCGKCHKGMGNAYWAQYLELQQAITWKNEDPRMLREQIRVADSAFQRVHEESKAHQDNLLKGHVAMDKLNKEKHQLEASLRLAVEAADRILPPIENNNLPGDSETRKLKETLSTIRANHPQLMEGEK
jgi:hypothetical protein